jgi:ABC-type antimicrobial peptide transport system permease subunit
MFADNASLSQSLSCWLPGLERELTNIMQVRGNVNIRNNCLVCGEVMSLINLLEHVVIVRINAFGNYANYHVL